MSKYKVGDKIVMEITKIFSDNFGTKDYIVKGFTRCDGKCLSEHSEPLSTYTLPLEDKIRKQTEEITRLLAENKELKEENAKLLCKVDSYELYGDQHEEEYNQAFNQGAEAAWELARKIVCFEWNGGYTLKELLDIFQADSSPKILNEHTYSEAAAKIAEWEKEKKEIKAGDIVKIHEGNDNNLCVLCMSTDKKYYNAVDRYGAVYYMLTKEMITKTGRHIDVDSFLKQIGGNGNERQY